MKVPDWIIFALTITIAPLAAALLPIFFIILFGCYLCGKRAWHDDDAQRWEKHRLMEKARAKDEKRGECPLIAIVHIIATP